MCVRLRTSLWRRSRRKRLFWTESRPKLHLETSRLPECPKRVFTRVSHKSVLKSVPLSHKGVLEKCRTRCPRNVSIKSVAQERHVSVPHKSATRIEVSIIILF